MADRHSIRGFVYASTETPGCCRIHHQVLSIEVPAGMTPGSTEWCRLREIGVWTLLVISVQPHGHRNDFILIDDIIHFTAVAQGPLRADSLTLKFNPQTFELQSADHMAQCTL